MKICDFCSDEVPDGDQTAGVYPATDIIDTKYNIAFMGSWLACGECAAFIRQYDSGQDDKARENLARRSLEKYRRKYGLNITGVDNRDVSVVLLAEIKVLHSKFWEHRDGEPVAYSIKALEC